MSQVRLEEVFESKTIARFGDSDLNRFISRVLELAADSDRRDQLLLACERAAREVFGDTKSLKQLISGVKKIEGGNAPIFCIGSAARTKVRSFR